MEENKLVTFAEEIMRLHYLANRDLQVMLRDRFLSSKEGDNTCKYDISNYVVVANGDLYYLENWANKNIRFWGNGEVVKYKPMKSNTKLVEARRIKLDGSLVEKPIWLVMVVDGFEDEEAGYLDCAFELEDEETMGG